MAAAQGTKGDVKERHRCYSSLTSFFSKGLGRGRTQVDGKWDPEESVRLKERRRRAGSLGALGPAVQGSAWSATRQDSAFRVPSVLEFTSMGWLLLITALYGRESCRWGSFSDSQAHLA